MPIDSRAPIEKLRRVELWKIAERRGFPFPPGAPKTTMIALLTANGVDVTKDDAINWQVVYPDPKEQAAAAAFGEAVSPELVPMRKAHASARTGVNADAARDSVVAHRTADEKQEDAFQDARLKALEKDNESLKAENDHLKDVIEKRLAVLEQQKEPEAKEAKNGKDRYWDLYRQAKSMNLPVKRGMPLDQVEALINRAQA